MLRRFLALGLALTLATPAAAQDQPHQRQARQILERLVSFRSAAGQGQVVPMIAYIRETLRAGGVPDADMVVIPHEETAALIVRVPGTDAAARPILFSAHMDVVDARPEDWQRSPFTLVEENGTFFGRGVLDNKTGVTSLISTILRLRASGQRPRNTLVFAFVGDEETTFGTTELIARHDWVRNARYAINTDAGGGMLAPNGQPLAYLVQGAEKTFASFRLTVTNPGGHSSRPRDDNAIYDLSRALAPGRGLSLPGDGERADPGLSRHARADRAGPGRPDADPLRRQSRGRGGGGGAAPLARIRRHDADHLHRHHARRRPCPERAAAARLGHRQLPDLPRRAAGGGPPGAGRRDRQRGGARRDDGQSAAEPGLGHQSRR